MITGGIVTLTIAFIFIKLLVQVTYYELGPRPSDDITRSEIKHKPSNDVSDGELFWFDSQHDNLF